MGDADRSTQEIRDLLRKLDPQKGGKHNDRVRRLARFRNYVTGDLDGSSNNNNNNNGKVTTPPFYDDDIPLLFTGLTLPDPDFGADEQDSSLRLYTLLEACGEPSGDKHGMLKRSAKHAMSLLKFLVCDFVDLVDSKPLHDVSPSSHHSSSSSDDLNGFAHALCSCSVEILTRCKFDLHILNLADDKRSGAKEDACEVLILLLTRHLCLAGISEEPVGLSDLLTQQQARDEFDLYVRNNKSNVVQQKLAEANKKFMNSTTMNATGGGVGTGGKEYTAESSIVNNDDYPIISSNQSVMTSSDKKKRATMNASGGGISSEMQRDETGPPSRWADSEFAKNPVVKKKKKLVDDDDDDDDENLEEEENIREMEREKSQALKEKERIDKERQRNLGRDPFGLRGNDFDLHILQNRRSEIIQNTLAMFQEEEEDEMLLGTTNRKDSKFLSLAERKQAFLNVIENSAKLVAQKRKEKEEAANNGIHYHDNKEQTTTTTSEEVGSIIPTDPDFDPMLFLTLVHGRATFQQLEKALTKINNSTDTQVLRLQNIVRDNFELFVRCADGIDIFSEEDIRNGKQNNSVGLVPEKMEMMDALADSCSSKAKKSFKPLLDNTNEVRKTQSALAVLQRVSPLLQVPTLMHQHIEASRFTSAIKAYRRILVIDESCEIDVLRYVKEKADEAARDAQQVLENTLSNDRVPVSTLLDAIRDLGELNELDLPEKDTATTKNAGYNAAGQTNKVSAEKDKLIRDYPAAWACLLLQTKHFIRRVRTVVEQTESVTTRVYNGDSSALYEDEVDGYYNGAAKDDHSVGANTSVNSGITGTSISRKKKKWRYDVLEARVKATIQAVSVANLWLNRLMRIAVAAREAERRQAARIQRQFPLVSSGARASTARGAGGGATSNQRMKKTNNNKKQFPENAKPPFNTFLAQIAPATNFLVSHAIFCALGCSNLTKSNGDDIKVTFGQNSKDELKILLKTPLPPRESSRCASELVGLVEIVKSCVNTIRSLKDSPDDDTNDNKIPAPPTYHLVNSPGGIAISAGEPLSDSVFTTEKAVVTMEKRRCIYAFHVCAKNSGRKASGSGIFDGDALTECVHNLSQVLSRPEDCATEVEKGCQLVVLKCCEGLAEYVRDRGDSARLGTVSECAKMLKDGIKNVIREVSYLTSSHCEVVEETMVNEVMALEETLFEEFMDETKKNVADCVKLGFLDYEEKNHEEEIMNNVVTFPGYLSASLMAIVKCRARVERALGDSMVRKSQNITYIKIVMSQASDTLIDFLCNDLRTRATRMRSHQADRMANQLQFLINTLRPNLSENMIKLAEDTRRMLSAKAGKKSIMDGPDGLAAIEELERLGRVYNMCFAD